MSELSVPLRPACLKEGHPCLSSPSSPLCLFLFLSLSPFSTLSPLSSLIIHSHPHQAWAGLRADVQTLSFRLGPHCRLRALLSPVACPGSFFGLSPPSCGQRRPYKATFLLIHFWQFQHCHSNHCSGEWRKAELAVSLAARTVLLGPGLGDVSTASKLSFYWGILSCDFYLFIYFCSQLTIFSEV